MKNTVVIFYSLGNNTKYVADYICDKLKCDRLRIEPKKKLKEEAFSKYFFGGMQAIFRMNPELLEYKIDIDKYDNVIIGSPVWGGNLSSPVRSFLNKEKIRDKNVFLYCCFAGDEGKLFENTEKLLTGNRIISKVGLKLPLKNKDEFMGKIGGFIEKIKNV